MFDDKSKSSVIIEDCDEDFETSRCCLLFSFPAVTLLYLLQLQNLDLVLLTFSYCCDFLYLSSICSISDMSELRSPLSIFYFRIRKIVDRSILLLLQSLLLLKLRPASLTISLVLNTFQIFCCQCWCYANRFLCFLRLTRA